MAQNYTEQLRKDNVRDAIYEDLQNNCEVLRTSWSGNAFPANPKVGQPCYRVDEDKLYYWDGYKWSQKGGGGSAELKTMELAAATSERVSITLEGARCLDKNMMFVFVDKIAQDPSTYSMNDDGTVVNFNPAIPANAAVTLRWFDTDVGTFDTAIFASDAEFAAGELTNKAPNVKQVHSLSDQIQTSNANYVKSELQSNLLNYTTNRILEIPQDIKLELNNGTLTLKAGSKVYVPNGFESDGITRKFDIIILTKDLTYTEPTSNASTLPLFVSSNGNGLFRRGKNNSGETVPDNYTGAFYNLTTNKMESYNGGSLSVTMSLPICVCTNSATTGNNIVSIDQVFNGFGYIGSTVFALPGVKVQIPNGRNKDGTYKSVIRTIDSVKTYDAGAWVSRNLKLIISGGDLIFQTQPEERFTYNKQFSSDTSSLSYDENTGYWWYSSDQSSWVKDIANILGSVIVENCKITQFQVDTVDSVVNSNASNFSQAGRSYLSGLGMPSSRYIKLPLAASGSTTYTAPANGWLFLMKRSTALGQNIHFICNVREDIVWGSGADAEDISLLFPVSSGDVVQITYTAEGPVSFFRFIYANGEQ